MTAVVKTTARFIIQIGDSFVAPGKETRLTQNIDAAAIYPGRFQAIAAAGELLDSEVGRQHRNVTVLKIEGVDVYRGP